MTFMVYYCPRHRRAWPISARAACPVGGKDCEIKCCDAIALIDELGEKLTEAGK